MPLPYGLPAGPLRPRLEVDRLLELAPQALEGAHHLTDGDIRVAAIDEVGQEVLVVAASCGQQPLERALDRGVVALVPDPVEGRDPERGGPFGEKGVRFRGGRGGAPGGSGKREKEKLP